MEDGRIDGLLAAIRLGDADRLGWWRSHSLDDTAEYVLGGAFPATWMATGLELAMESARVRHEQILERSSQIHLFSDYLPYHRQLRNWLVERKLERDEGPMQWLRSASIEDLRDKLPDAVDGERRAGGFYLGEVVRSDLGDAEVVDDVVDKLLAGVARLDEEFVAPYLDLAD